MNKMRGARKHNGAANLTIFKIPGYIKDMCWYPQHSFETTTATFNAQLGELLDLLQSADRLLTKSSN